MYRNTLRNFDNTKETQYMGKKKLGGRDEGLKGALPLKSRCTMRLDCCFLLKAACETHCRSPISHLSQLDPVHVHQYRLSGSDGSTHRLCVYECVNHRTTQNQVSAVSLVSVLGCSFTLVLLLSPLHCLNHRHLLGLLLLVPGLILQPGNTQDGMMCTCGS